MAGNVRFHNKFHAHTHYTDAISGIPDSATDPIASQEFPFLGNMYVAGCLSARGWLDEDGTCRKFLYDPEPMACRPVKICGDHMEGALHYSHTNYNNEVTYDPKRLEIDFKKDTFKTIICDANEYHIMPISLSAGCVTSTRFVNPSSNGGVDLAWHPHLQWLCPKPCYLSAGEEAIVSMTSFSNVLCSVVCIWKERETELADPYVVFSPTITFHPEYLQYNITTCEPIKYNFVLDSSADVARLDILGTSVLLYDDDGEFVWDDTSMVKLLSAYPDMEMLPTKYEMYTTFPARAGNTSIDDINSIGELLSRDKIVPFQVPIKYTYGNCEFQIEYTARGSIFFEIRVNGATGETQKPVDKNYLGKITVGETSIMGFNGVYTHDMEYYDNYVGSDQLKSTVLDMSIFIKLVQPHDRYYEAGKTKYYTIEQHEQGPRKWWIMKAPDGRPVWQNSERNYSNERYYPPQNRWVELPPTGGNTPPELFSDTVRLQKMDGVVFVDGDEQYITDEYIDASMAGSSYGECFDGWDSLYTPPSNTRLVPEDTSSSDDSEFVIAIAIPGGPVVVDRPMLLLDPLQFTQNTNNPNRYTPGQKIRLYIDNDLAANDTIDTKYLNNITGVKSASDSKYTTGGTYIVANKQFVSIPSGQTTIGVSLSCA